VIIIYYQNMNFHLRYERINKTRSTLLNLSSIESKSLRLGDVKINSKTYENIYNKFNDFSVNFEECFSGLTHERKSIPASQDSKNSLPPLKQGKNSFGTIDENIEFINRDTAFLENTKTSKRIFEGVKFLKNLSFSLNKKGMNTYENYKYFEDACADQISEMQYISFNKLNIGKKKSLSLSPKKKSKSPRKCSDKNCTKCLQENLQRYKEVNKILCMKENLQQKRLSMKKKSLTTMMIFPINKINKKELKESMTMQNTNISSDNENDKSESIHKESFRLCLHHC
jgi:hypothetical protein